MTDPRFEPLPSDKSKYSERLARDLAWGFLNAHWRNRFLLQGIPAWGDLTLLSSDDPNLEKYVTEVWYEQLPNMSDVVDMGFLGEVPNSGTGDDTFAYKLTEKGLLLAQGALAGSIFISYRRIESSAFAVLLSDRLMRNGLAPFLDNQPDKEQQGISLKPGRNWSDDIETAIRDRDNFVVLIGPSTLLSENVCKEIQLALSMRKKIIPVWHRGFDPKNPEHLPEYLQKPIRDVVTELNAINVSPEEPLQYEVAIGRLLSVFGIQG